MSTSLVTQVTTTLMALSGWPVYALVAGLAFAESGPLLAVVVPAAVLGDDTGFLSGRRFGSRLRRGRLARRTGEAR